MFLTKEEVFELTGYKTQSFQIKWLIRRGFKFEIGADGRPKILRDFVHLHLGGKSLPKVFNDEPNLSDTRFFR